jgi:signal transduction histidine kinase
METSRRAKLGKSANVSSRFHIALQACLVAVLCYLAARLGGALILRPQMVSPLWLGNVLLVSVLLLVRRKLWPVLLATSLAGFFLYDLQTGVPIRSISWLILSNAVEVLTAALCLHNSFGGVPRLNSVKALAKYSFYAVFLAPFVGAFFGALSTSSNYWASWKVAFFSEALGFLTLMPAILGWAKGISTWAQKPRAYYLEATALLVALVILGQLAFAAPGKSSPPALLYSLVPLLLWSTLRFGATGVSSSMVAIAFVSIWGAVHGRGPFTEPGPLINVLSLQLFLFFTAAPFMVLAALVEERKQAEGELREGEERLRLAVHAGRMYAFEWDTTTDVIVRSGECGEILNWMDDPTRDTGRQFVGRVLPGDREAYAATETGLTPENPTYQTSYRMLRPDGSVIWLEESGHGFFDGRGKMLRTIGMVADVTERKLAEEALSSVSRRLIEAQEQERTRIARELHDDIGQRLALLTIELEQLQENPPSLLTEICRRMGKLGKQTSEIATDIQALSHELHSSNLDYLGIAAAMRGFCKKFGEQQRVEIDCKAHDLPTPLPTDISLCLFRVLQEALHNSAKHSGAQQCEVRLWATPDDIHLTVSDSGAGFDSEAAKERRGLGLISMEERLKLLNGTFSIDSQPKRGTTIHARVPLNSGSIAMREAGEDPVSRPKVWKSPTR